MNIKSFYIGRYKFLLSKDIDGWQVTNSMNQTFKIDIGYVTCLEEGYLIRRIIIYKYELVWCRI